MTSKPPSRTSGRSHKRTRPRRPQTNGKSERFNRTLLDEWAYARPFDSNNKRLLALPEFVDRYNNHRPHTALNGLTPMAALVNNVSGNRQLALIGIMSAAVAAYGDWVWWEPYRGVVITLAAGVVLVVAVVLATVRRTRPAAIVVAVVGLGLVAGQNLGPSRPELQHSEGTMTVTLSSPGPASGTGPATCAMDAAATELSVSGDSNLRLAIVPDNPAAPSDIDQREFVWISLTVGDRWIRSPDARSDMRAFQIGVGRVEADMPESRMVSGQSTSLEIAWSAAGGTLRFAGLTAQSDTSEARGDFIDLAGTLEWTCGRQ